MPDPIAAYRAPIMRAVRARERGLCLVCGRRGEEVHEIEQRSHHPKAKQIEMGTFSMANCVFLCRKCHADIGNTRFGELMLAYLLHARYGYERPNLWI